MKKSDVIFGFLVGIIGIGIGFIIGGTDKMLNCLLMMMTLDIFTGITFAVQSKELSSNEMFKGGCKKFGIICIVAISVVLGTALDLTWLRNVVIGFFIGMELISIMENWSKCGLPIPKFIKTLLTKIDEKFYDKNK